jgi:hypothetical protein
VFMVATAVLGLLEERRSRGGPAKRAGGAP